MIQRWYTVGDKLSFPYSSFRSDPSREPPRFFSGSLFFISETPCDRGEPHNSWTSRGMASDPAVY